jgi:hypothetical protein
VETKESDKHEASKKKKGSALDMSHTVATSKGTTVHFTVFTVHFLPAFNASNDMDANASKASCT